MRLVVRTSPNLAPRETLLVAISHHRKPLQHNGHNAWGIGLTIAVLGVAVGGGGRIATNTGSKTPPPKLNFTNQDVAAVVVVSNGAHDRPQSPCWQLRQGLATLQMQRRIKRQHIAMHKGLRLTTTAKGVTHVLQP